MSFKNNAQVFQQQVVITDTTTAVGLTSGSFVNYGGFSTRDTYVSGHAVVNDVKITPNKNDIVFELQAILDNNVSEFTNIQDFLFNNNSTNSFKAIVNVTVSTGVSKYAVWEINGLYKPTGWVITSSFTGDLTGVTFNIANNNGVGQIQYKNSNASGTTTIRYRATTTAPPGSTPLDASLGVINNTSGPFLTNNLIYASATNTLASTDIVYNSNVFTIGGTSRIVGENANSFVNFSNGGAITSMGDASIAKNLIVGQNIGIGTTSPSYALDVSGGSRFVGEVSFGVSNIFSGSYTGVNNRSSATNVTGLAFDTASIRGFTALVVVSIVRSSGGNLYENFTLDGIQTDNGWSLYPSSVGDLSGVVFTITSGGQIQYTCSNYTNLTSFIMKYSVTQVTI